MSLLKNLRPRESDEEYIEKLRRSLDRWERLRPYGVAASGLILIIFGWLYLEMIDWVLHLGKEVNPRHALLGLALGFTLGLAFGWAFHSALRGLFMFASPHQRPERLLLKYHDALLEVIAEKAEAKSGGEGELGTEGQSGSGEG